jgi:ubiquinone biosynthesis monooxygenase Coq7
MTAEWERVRKSEMLRVDHAGEHGAVAIYSGQMAVFRRIAGKERILLQLEDMKRQEEAHLKAFDALLADERVRPTVMGPIWRAAGFALGAATAILGEKAAHACTEAVESVIETHYGDQAVELRHAGDSVLAARIEQFREEEVAHKNIAIAEGAGEAPGYPLLTAAIRTACRLAIRVSEKI